MKNLITTTFAVLTLFAFSPTVDAQVFITPGGTVQTTPGTPYGHPGGGFYGGGGGFYGGGGYYDHGYRGPYYDPYRPSVPVGVSPNRVTGINPWTGGLNTGNSQVNNTRFDYGRDGSAHNGSRRWVRRPVYDAYGNITGYKEGWVWNNSFTGQEHGNLNVRTPNSTGGEHNTNVQYMVMEEPKGSGQGRANAGGK